MPSAIAPNANVTASCHHRRDIFLQFIWIIFLNDPKETWKLTAKYVAHKTFGVFVF